MGYKHLPVRHVALDRSLLQSGHRFELDTRIEASKAQGWQWWLDTIPVSREVYELGVGVRKAYPFVKFYVTSNYASGSGMFLSHQTNSGCKWDDDAQYALEIFVAIDTCPYILAKIGYADYSVQGNGGTATYMVSARGISNDKYYFSRAQYCMRITGSLKSAVKNTLANLLPYTTAEIAEQEYVDYHEKSKTIGRSKTAQLPVLLGSVTHSVLLNEIRALKAMGVVFSTPEFRNVAESCDEAAKLANEERNKKVAAILIHFVARSDGIVAECASMQNIRDQSEFRLDLSVTYPIADVPQALQAKVAVLQTLPPGDHVDGVGMKVEDMLYWVEK